MPAEIFLSNACLQHLVKVKQLPLNSRPCHEVGGGGFREIFLSFLFALKSFFDLIVMITIVMMLMLFTTKVENETDRNI